MNDVSRRPRGEIPSEVESAKGHNRPKRGACHHHAQSAPALSRSARSAAERLYRSDRVQSLRRLMRAGLSPEAAEDLYHAVWRELLEMPIENLSAGRILQLCEWRVIDQARKQIVRGRVHALLANMG